MSKYLVKIDPFSDKRKDIKSVSYSILAQKIIQLALSDLTSKVEKNKTSAKLFFSDKEWLNVICDIAGIDQLFLEKKIKIFKKTKFKKSMICIAIRKERRDKIENSILSK